MGMIVTLYNKFYAENDLFEQEESKEAYQVLMSSFDVPIGYVMFQLASYLTFYHEQGHLIQKSPMLIPFLNEYNAAVGDLLGTRKSWNVFKERYYAKKKLEAEVALLKIG